MTTTNDVHKLDGYEHSRRGVYAACTCGWSSRRHGTEATAFKYFLRHVVYRAKVKERVDAGAGSVADARATRDSDQEG
jgi:hypothetical protein